MDADTVMISLKKKISPNIDTGCGLYRENSFEWPTGNFRIYFVTS